MKTLKKIKKKPNYAFIDSQNLHMGIKALGWKLDYKKFIVYLKDKYNVSKVFMFIGYLKENESMYQNLRSFGYDIVFKNTKQFGKSREQVKGNIDVDLTVDAIRKSEEYGLGIFVSADGDFSALYDYLIDEKSKKILIFIPNKFKYSKFLLKYRSSLRFMNDLKSKVGL